MYTLGLGLMLLTVAGGPVQQAVPESAYCSNKCGSANAHCQTPCYDDGAWSTCQAAGEGWNAPLWTNVTHQVQQPVRALHGPCGEDWRAAKIDRYWQEDACGVYTDRFVCYFTPLYSCAGQWDLEVPWCPFCGFNKPCPE